MVAEFDLIARFFTKPTTHAALGIGDDCALLRLAAGSEFAVSTDTLVEGTHFFRDADAEKLGHKSLAVNLSDLAAMGATPRYAMLALTLPETSVDWLEKFSRGFFALADRHAVELIGGDTTRGPLSITITVFGEVAQGRALRRDAARADDDVWVTGALGGAALALAAIEERIPVAISTLRAVEGRLHTPEPRVAIGQALLGVAHAAIDVSDGLIADLTHIAERSQLAATIARASVPMSAGLLGVRADLRDACALAGGDDYELCFTAAQSQRAAIEKIAETTGVAVTRIGHMHARGEGALVKVLDERGADVTPSRTGYKHFGALPEEQSLNNNT
jgi:thiamine-monophosphate kinase